ncbi:hypothetical protein GCM10010360_73800 [Streptomyces nogalater]
MLVRVPQRGTQPLQLECPQLLGPEPFARVQQIRRIRHRNVSLTSHIFRTTVHSVVVAVASNSGHSASGQGVCGILPAADGRRAAPLAPDAPDRAGRAGTTRAPRPLGRPPARRGPARRTRPGIPVRPEDPGSAAQGGGWTLAGCSAPIPSAPPA